MLYKQAGDKVRIPPRTHATADDRHENLAISFALRPCVDQIHKVSDLLNSEDKWRRVEMSLYARDMLLTMVPCYVQDDPS